MEHKSNLTNAYSESYSIASRQLCKKDPAEIAICTNAVYDMNSRILRLLFLHSPYLVHCDSGEVRKESSSEQIPVSVKALILHYLTFSKISPLSSNLISFKELSGGISVYYPSFYKRAISPLIKAFSGNFDKFNNAINLLGGTKEKYGSASGTINIFPLVPVTYVLWKGDEEIADSATILFDDSVTCFLPGEDIALAASLGVYEMIKVTSGK